MRRSLFALVGLIGTGILFAASTPQDKAAQAGPEEALTVFAGSWTAKVKFQGEPGQPGMEGEGTETNTLAIGGKWILSDFKGTMGGNPFEGHGVIGYDPRKEKYVSCWADSWSNSLGLSEGTYDEKSKTFTFTMEEISPETGKPVQTRHSYEIRNNDEILMTFLVAGPEGKDIPVGTIEYKRKS